METEKKKDGADDGVTFAPSSDWNVSRNAVWGAPAAADCTGVGG